MLGRGFEESFAQAGSSPLCTLSGRASQRVPVRTRECRGTTCSQRLRGGDPSSRPVIGALRSARSLARSVSRASVRPSWYGWRPATRSIHPTATFAVGCRSTEARSSGSMRLRRHATDPREDPRPFGSRSLARWGVALALLAARAGLVDVPARAGDRLKELQTAYVANHGPEDVPRAYHFGSQGPGDVFSNHTSHTNRLVPVYLFGRKADLGAVTGENSRYRDPEKIKATLRVPAREHGQPPRRLRRPERPLPGAEGGRRAGGQAPVHRLVRRPGLADHAGRRDRQDGQGLHRGEGLGPDLPGLHGRRHGAVRLRASPARPTTRTRPTSTRRRSPSRPTASAAATTRGSPARTPGRSARSGRRPPATSRGSRPTRPTARA